MRIIIFYSVLFIFINNFFNYTYMLNLDFLNFISLYIDYNFWHFYTNLDIFFFIKNISIDLYSLHNPFLLSFLNEWIIDCVFYLSYYCLLTSGNISAELLSVFIKADLYYNIIVYDTYMNLSVFDILVNYYYTNYSFFYFDLNFLNFFLFEFYNYYFSNLSSLFLHYFDIKSLGTLIYIMYPFIVFLMGIFFFLILIGIISLTYSFNYLTINYSLFSYLKFNSEFYKYINYYKTFYSNLSLIYLTTGYIKIFPIKFISPLYNYYYILFLGLFLFFFITLNLFYLHSINFMKFILIIEFYFLSIISLLIFFSLIHFNYEGFIFIFLLLSIFAIETVLGLSLFVYKSSNSINFSLK